MATDAEPPVQFPSMLRLADQVSDPALLGKGGRVQHYQACSKADSYAVPDDLAAMSKDNSHYLVDPKNAVSAA